SYGSGAVGEFFTGIVRPGHQQLRRRESIEAQIAGRVRLELPAYRELHGAEHPSGTDWAAPSVTEGPFRFAGIRDRARRYEATHVAAAQPPVRRD
ncbi:MAG: hypothetical protein L0H39_12260, partial [Brachybacterium sp.]|nr:hypothetical protein [Brachybacterium sp.]